MALSEKEDRLLRAIEATLVADDPDWARQFADSRPLRPRGADPRGGLLRGRVRPRHLVWALLLTGWVAMLLLGLVLGSTGLTLAAVGILLWGPLVCVVAGSYRSSP
ncbi:DUF3040 domain-containing protein [Streptomyces sp. ICBB 8177]|uniref:DUF3040 domain-containing protein n=1 Tax=Streptomyces sp. ICBB 8177 TaxID=563922 RepID=UPI000D682A32|nr:DUF3040 domain-containing protein [Streptomyces sp. ICBB 8177]PWI40977.1 hypothetical protein CK485_26680 [Streptomyces sp. ICBB 8177]